MNGDGLNEYIAKELARRAKISAALKGRKRTTTKARGRKRAQPPKGR